MMRILLPATVACAIATAQTPVRGDVDVRLWLGAPGLYYVPGHGAVLRFGVHPRRHHGHRPIPHYHGAKAYRGHLPARPHFWHHGRKHHWHHALPHGYRPGDFRRHDSRRYGYRDGLGHRHYYRDSRTRIYTY